MMTMNLRTSASESRPAARVTPQAVEAIYATGHGLHSRGLYRDAAALFRVLILCAPRDERGYLALGSCHEGLGEEEIALEIYAGALTIATTSARLHVARGRVLLSSGQDFEADAAFEEALRLAEVEEDDDVRAMVAHERRVP